MATPFADGVNALCWTRPLPGDFGEIAARLDSAEGITTIDDARLRALCLSKAGQVAREFILRDIAMLRVRAQTPVLDCIRGYTHDLEVEPMATHVQSFHVDSATGPAATILCTYLGASSEGLRPEDARRHVDLPATRAKLLRFYGGEDDAGFLNYLSEHFYDLHYAALPGARPFSFGVGNLWRITCQYPGCPVPPCIHRAPPTVPGQPPRLLLIC